MGFSLSCIVLLVKSYSGLEPFPLTLCFIVEVLHVFTNGSKHRWRQYMKNIRLELIVSQGIILQIIREGSVYKLILITRSKI